MILNVLSGEKSALTCVKIGAFLLTEKVSTEKDLSTRLKADHPESMEGGKKYFFLFFYELIRLKSIWNTEYYRKNRCSNYSEHFVWNVQSDF